MTKSDVKTILDTVAEEFEAVDQPELARAYRRASSLVDQIDEGVRRRRRRRVTATTAAPAAPRPAGAPRRGRPPRSAQNQG